MQRIINLSAEWRPDNDNSPPRKVRLFDQLIRLFCLCISAYVAVAIVWAVLHLTGVLHG